MFCEANGTDVIYIPNKFIIAHGQQNFKFLIERIDTNLLNVLLVTTCSKNDI